MSKIKNFKDLVFIPHPIAGEAQKLPLYLAKEYAEAKHISQQTKLRIL